MPVISRSIFSAPTKRFINGKERTKGKSLTMDRVADPAPAFACERREGRNDNMCYAETNR